MLVFQLNKQSIGSIESVGLAIRQSINLRMSQSKERSEADTKIHWTRVSLDNDELFIILFIDTSRRIQTKNNKSSEELSNPTVC